jgi:hypothetical protein
MDVLFNISVDVRDTLTGAAIEAGVSALEARIKRLHPQVGRVFIEVQGSAASDAEIPEGDVGGLPDPA